MGLIRDIQDGIYVGSSIVLIVFAVLEAISIIVAVIISLSISKSSKINDATNGLIAFLYWVVAWLIQQIYVLPITWFFKWLNEVSRPRR